MSGSGVKIAPADSAALSCTNVESMPSSPTKSHMQQSTSEAALRASQSTKGPPPSYDELLVTMGSSTAMTYASSLRLLSSPRLLLETSFCTAFHVPLLLNLGIGVP